MQAPWGGTLLVNKVRKEKSWKVEERPLGEDVRLTPAQLKITRAQSGITLGLEDGEFGVDS